MIRLENITKIYNEKIDDTKALDDVSLKIEDGEFVAVMGASGSGKSTLLKIIGCMDTPTAGKYFLDDTEVTAASRSQVHKLRKEKIRKYFIVRHNLNQKCKSYTRKYSCSNIKSIQYYLWNHIQYTIYSIRTKE